MSSAAVAAVSNGEVVRHMLIGGAELNRPLYNYNSPEEVDLFKDCRVILDLIATASFNRLKDIRFLGGIDYLIVRNPNGIRGRYTRRQHSLGVARLALRYAALRALDALGRDLVTVAALLHDIGHAPLSHSLEPVFSERFGIDHHAATADIVAGRSPLGSEVYDVLRLHSIDVERVLALMAGQDQSFDCFFYGPINFDTVEGILRSQSYNPLSQASLLNPEAIMEAALFRKTESHRKYVDEFWTYKDQIYGSVVNSQAGVLADYACRAHMEANMSRFTAADYYATEDLVFQKMPGLRSLLTDPAFESLVLQHLKEPVCFKARKFYINQDVNFYLRDDRARYLQRKEDRILTLKLGNRNNLQVAEKDLFDDSIRAEQDIFE